MFCKNCGAQITNGSRFCEKCGAAIEAQPQQAQPAYQQAQPAYQQAQPAYQQAQPAYQQAQPAYQQPQQQPQTPYVQPAAYNSVSSADKHELASTILKFGIMGLAFSVACFIFCYIPFVGIALGVVGVVFSTITRKRAEEYIGSYGETEGKASVGKNLALGGLISGIVGIVCASILTITLLAGF